MLLQWKILEDKQLFHFQKNTQDGDGNTEAIQQPSSYAPPPHLSATPSPHSRRSAHLPIATHHRTGSTLSYLPREPATTE